MFTSHGLAGFSWRAGVSRIWLEAASDTFLFLFPLGLLPRGVFPNVGVLGRRVVLLVSENSEAVLTAVSDVGMRSLLRRAN